LFFMQLRDLPQTRSFFGKSPGEIIDRMGVLLLLLYLLAGMIYSAVVHPAARFLDEKDYLTLSDNLVHGPGFSMDGVHPTACRPPAYAFFLAGIRARGGDFFSFRAANFVMTGATIFLVCRLCPGKKMFGGLLIVTGLVVCYPVLFYTSATLYPQTLIGFFFILAIALIVITPRGVALNVVTGFSFGLLILGAPAFLLTVAVVLGTARFLKIIRWRDVVLIALVTFLMTGTWTLRNAAHFHRFVPVTSNSGINFLVGNNPQATAYEAAANAALDPYYEHVGNLGLDEFQGDHYYWETALTWIKGHPGDATVLYFEKVLNFFNIINVYESGNRAEFPAWRQVVMAASYLLLLGLLGRRLVEIKRFPLIPREKLFLIVYVLSAFTSAIFFTRIRHRLPYDYLIIAIIAMDLSRRFEIWMTAQRSQKQASSVRESNAGMKSL
jgi:hypothetical protein